jgi:hypothetical protein
MRVNSNYKGFSVCQSRSSLDESRSDSSRKTGTVEDHVAGAGCVELRARCGLEKLQPVIDAVD